MKTQRRHELRTNELSTFLLEANDWTRKHSTQIGTVVVVAVVVLLAYALLKRSRTGSTDAAWQTMRELKFTLEDADASFDRVDQLIKDASDRDFRMIALLRKARSAMSLATQQADGFHPDYLDEADAAYQELLKEYSDRMVVAATALDGLTSVEESRFAVDGDPQHKVEARKYLERLVNGAEFKGTPFQTDAARRLQDLDSTLQTVAMAEAPPAPEPVEPATDLGNAFRLTTPDELGLDLASETMPAAGDQKEPAAEKPVDESDEPPPDSADQGGDQ